MKATFHNLFPDELEFDNNRLHVGDFNIESVIKRYLLTSHCRLSAVIRPSWTPTVPAHLHGKQFSIQADSQESALCSVY